MIGARLWRRMKRFAAGAIAAWAVMFFWPRWSPDGPHAVPNNSCSMLLIDPFRPADALLREVEDPFRRLCSREGGGRIAVAAWDSDSPWHFKVLRDPTAERLSDEMEWEKLTHQLGQVALDEDHPHQETFLSSALEHAHKLIRQPGYSDCESWEIFLLASDQHLRITDSEASRIANRAIRFCPTNTRIVLPRSEATTDDDEALAALSELFESHANLFRLSLGEFEAMRAADKHLLYVDISGSVRSDMSPEIWFQDLFSKLVLRCFQAQMPAFPGREVDIHVFGAERRRLGTLSTDPIMFTPYLSRETARDVDPEHTSLAGVLQDLEQDQGDFDSVWVYTDGEDRPGKGQPSLVDWVDRHCGSQTENAPAGGRRLYLQLPTGRAGRNDPGVQTFLRGARCLGFRAQVVPSPPPKEALDLCRRGV